MKPLTAAAWIAAFFFCANLFSHTVALRLLLLLSGIALVAAAAWKERHSLMLKPPLWLPFLAWGIWAGLSSTWSLEPARSLKEFQNEIVYCALAFWVCYVAAQAADAHRIMIRVAAAGAVAVCAVSIYYISRSFWAYAQGPHGGSGNHSSALLTMMPCALMLGWYAHRAGWTGVRKAMPWIMVAIFLVSAWATFNRTIWLGFAVQLILMGVLLLRKRRAAGAPPPTAKARAVAAMLALAVLAGAGTMLYQVQSSRVSLVKEGQLLDDARFALWKAIVERIEDRPLTGYGFGRGMFRGVLQKEMDNLSLWHSHNLILDVLLQVGVPGLILLLVLLGTTLREGWRLGRDPDDAASACGIAIVAVVSGMIVRNMTDVLWVRQNALLYWSVLGVLLAWGRPRRARAAG